MLNDRNFIFIYGPWAPQTSMRKRLRSEYVHVTPIDIVHVGNYNLGLLLECVHYLIQILIT